MRHASNAAYHYTDKGISNLGRWLVTDHSGCSQSMLNMPSMGFLDTCRYILTQFIIAVLGAVLYGLLVGLMITYGMPALISALLS